MTRRWSHDKFNMAVRFAYRCVPFDRKWTAKWTSHGIST